MGLVGQRKLDLNFYLVSLDLTRFGLSSTSDTSRDHPNNLLQAFNRYFPDFNLQVLNKKLAQANLILKFILKKLSKIKTII